MFEKGLVFRAKSYADKYNAAKKVVDTIDADDTWAGIDNAKAKLSKEQTDFADKYKDYVKKYVEKSNKSI